MFHFESVFITITHKCYFTLTKLHITIEIYSLVVIYVTFCVHSNRSIALMSVSRTNNICLVRTLTTSFDCFTISPMDEEMFLVSTLDHPHPVRTITVHGKEGDVQHAGLPDKTHKLEWNMCTYVAEHKTLVLTDKEDNKVYLCNTESGRCETVQCDQIKAPKGACPGNQGTVFVASMKTHSIVELSVQGEVLASTDVGMKYPYAVCLSRDGKRMAISNCYNQENKKIKLFTLSN